MPDLKAPAPVSSGQQSTVGRVLPAQIVIPATAVSSIRIALKPPATSAEIRGTVQSQDASGLTQVKTDSGTITLQTAARLPVGTAVTLRIDASEPDPRIYVIRSSDRAPVQDQPKAAATDPAVTIETSGSSEQLARVAAPATSDATRGLARAVVLSPVASPAEAAALLPTNILAQTPQVAANPGLPPNPASLAAPATAHAPSVPLAPAATAIAASAAGLVDISGSPQPAIVVPSPTQPAPTQPLPVLPGMAGLPEVEAAATVPAGAPKPSGLAPVRPVLAQGTELPVRIIGTATLHASADDAAFSTAKAVPAKIPDTGSPVARAATLQATVEGFLPRGEAVLRTDVARLAIQLPAGWAHIRSGDTLAIELALPSSSPVAPPPPLAASDRSMPGLRGLEAALAATRNLPETVGLPRPGPRLARQLVRFVDAARSGAAEPIFGPLEAAQSLGEPVKSLAARAAGELREAGHPAEQPRDWKLVLVPLMTEAGLVPLKFFSRRQAQTAQRGKADDASRFVIECDHASLGAVAIDGLVHGRRIDVVVKTEAKLGVDAQHDLLALFDDAIGAMGFAGELRFQGAAPVARIPVAVPADRRLGLTA